MSNIFLYDISETAAHLNRSYRTGAGAAQRKRAARLWKKTLNNMVGERGPMQHDVDFLIDQNRGCEQEGFLVLFMGGEVGHLFLPRKNDWRELDQRWYLLPYPTLMEDPDQLIRERGIITLSTDGAQGQALAKMSCAEVVCLMVSRLMGRNLGQFR